MDLTGIENEAEFFPAGTLSDVLEVELQDITNRWSKDLEGTNPLTRLISAAEAYTRVYRRLLNISDKSVRTELYSELTSRAATALGYEVKRASETLALDSGSLARVLNKAFDADGKPALWILETPTPATGEEQADPLSQSFDKEQFSADEAEYAETDLAVEELLAEGIFDLADAPRYVLVAGASQWVLVDQRKWPARAVLRFDLQEIFSRQDRDTLRVMACLIAREARVPVTGVPISDRLEEEAQRNANLVTTSLKKTVRDAIEFLGQEVLDVTEGKFPSGPKRGVWIDGPTLSLECLRYMYRLLFLLYAESNPRLKILDLKDPLYASGYSMEALRDLESVRLRTPQEKKGTYLWESLQQVLTLLYSGENHILQLPAVKVSLLDPESTPLLNSLKLRNEAVQKIIRLLSLRSSKKSTGRISYSKLGIGQLGAVYETLISFTGTVCKEDMIELKGDSKDRAAVEVDSEEDSEVPEGSDLLEDDEVESRVDKVDLLAPTYFVPRRRIGEFNPEAVVFEGTQAKIYPKGSFTYRLAGRDREKTAAYYTPEPLARLLVKHLLMERCEGLAADEILELKILEPAMGSAAFLVETTNQLADLYLERKQAEVGRVIPQEDIILEKQKVRSYIADRNCFGVDLNPTAVELGAISLWLNGLHKGEFSPWFGDQLHAGNSLIGARRAVYPVSQLKGKGADLWLKHPPKEIGWKEERPEKTVYQWLLPAEDMVRFESDNSIKAFAGHFQEQIKTWRKAGFYKPLEQHEINLVQRLTKVADELFEIVASELARTRNVANDEITLWPEHTMAGAKGVGYQKKEVLKQRLLGEDHAQNTLPYKRLKTAMDAWCALWLWPIEQADKLPTRREFLEGMRILLEGGFSADGSLSAGTEDDFATPMEDLFEPKDAEAPPEYSMGLFQETNVEAFIDEYEWLQVAAMVVEEARFVHYDLIFADILKMRGGFDLVVGNPPWSQPKFIPARVLEDLDPIFHGMSAAESVKKLPCLMSNKTRRIRYLERYTSEKGSINFIGSANVYPLSASGATNLYRNFIELSWYLQASNSYAGLIHQDAHLFSPTNDLLRKRWYRQTVKSFEFSNQITAKNFSEVLNTKRFSLNIYRGRMADISIAKLTSMFVAGQVDECFSKDNLDAPASIRANGKWNTRGSPERLVLVDQAYLDALSELMPSDVADNPTFLHPLTRSHLATIAKLASLPSLARSPVVTNFELGPSEQNLLSSGLAKKDPSWTDANGPIIVSSPSLMLGDVCAKTPRKNASNFKHYDPVEPEWRSSSYRPRSMFNIQDVDKCREAFFLSGNSANQYHFNKYRFAFRKMVDPGAPRTLVGTILPPDYWHIEQLVSISTHNTRDLVDLAGNLISLSSDFLIKSLLISNLYESTISKLPFVRLSDSARNRVLMLVARNEEYAELVGTEYSNYGWDDWSSIKPGMRGILEILESSPKPLTYFSLNQLERRQAEIELDVLCAKALGLKLAELLSIYSDFDLLNKNDSSTIYDSRGRIFFSKASGFEKIGFLNKSGKSLSESEVDQYLVCEDQVLSCEILDDTSPAGTCKIVRTFKAPFCRFDRKYDYEVAWSYFDKLEQEGKL